MLDARLRPLGAMLGLAITADRLRARRLARPRKVVERAPVADVVVERE
jgi:hypothetical protein